MGATRFDHVNILTEDIDGVSRFLIAVLGVRPGPRPAFRSPGHWLYQDDVAIFHISDSSHHEQTHVADIGAVDTSKSAGAVDHLAFRCDDYREMIDRLNRLAIAFHEEDLPYEPARQVFVDGPNGITLELIFGHEDVLAGGGRIIGKFTREMPMVDAAMANA